MLQFRTSIFAAAIVGVSLALVAMPVQAQDATIKLEMKDGVLTPNPLEVPAKKAFKLEIKNTGKTAAEFESKDLRKEKVVGPGKTVTIDFRPLDPGEYAYFDEYHEAMTKNAKIIAK